PYAISLVRGSSNTGPMAPTYAQQQEQEMRAESNLQVELLGRLQQARDEIVRLRAELDSAAAAAKQGTRRRVVDGGDAEGMHALGAAADCEADPNWRCVLQRQ